jgi:hypothetical protein
MMSVGLESMESLKTKSPRMNDEIRKMMCIVA